MKKRFFIALFLLIILSTYNFTLNPNFIPNLNIKKIIVKNNEIINDDEIRKKLSFLYETNILFTDLDIIEKKLKKIDLIESFKIKKVYPNEIQITIREKKPIAIIQNKKKKKYFTSTGDLIDFIDLKRFENLPLVYGDKESFEDIHNNLKSLNFPITKIKKFYLFESKRWDLLTTKNQLIKLPIENYDKSLVNFMTLKDKINFNTYKIFDYRIKDQLILK